MEELKPIGADASGHEVITNAVLEMLNSYPGLDGKEIYFEEIGDADGIAFSSDSGPLVMTERRSITDHIFQTCQYPFFVIYRSTTTREYQKLYIQNFLDSLGKWLCKESVEINGETHRLTKYPNLSDNRKITRITRENAYGLTPNENKSQDWMLPVTIQYTNEFDLW